MNNMENNFEFLFEDDDNSFDFKRIEESILLKKFLDSVSEEYKSFLPLGDLNSTIVLKSLSIFDSLLNTNPYYVYLVEAENDKKAKMEAKKAKMVAKFKKQQEAIKQKLAQLKQQEGSLQPDQQVEKIGVTARIKKGNAAKAKVTSIIKKIEGDEKAGDYAKLADVLNAELEAYAKYAKLKVQQIEAEKKEGGDKGEEKKDNPNKAKETEYKKKKLEDKISSAEKKLNDIKDSNPEKAQKIQSAIDSMYDALDKLDKSPNESSYISRYLEIDLKLDSIIAELNGDEEYEIIDQIFTEYTLFEEEGEGDLKQKVKDAKIEYLEATVQTKEIKLGLAGDKGKEKWTNSIKNTQSEIDALKKGEDGKGEKPELKLPPKAEPKNGEEEKSEKPELKLPPKKEEPKEEKPENQEQIDAAQQKVDDLQKEIKDLTQEMDNIMDNEEPGIKSMMKTAQLGFKIQSKEAELGKAKGELAKAKGEDFEPEDKSKELEKAKEAIKKAEEEGVNLEKAKEAAKEGESKDDEASKDEEKEKEKEEEKPEDKSKEAKEKKQEEIEKLRDLIKNEEEKLESSTEDANTAIGKIKLEIDKKSAGKRKLNTIVNVGRAEGKVEFYKAIIGMAITEDDKKTYTEKLKSAQKQLAAMTGDLEKWEKKNKEEHKDDEEVQKAQKELKKDEPKEEKKPEEKPEAKDEKPEIKLPPKAEPKKDEQPETSKVAEPEKEKPEIKLPPKAEPKKDEPKKVPVTNEPKKPEEKKAAKKDENPNDYKIRMAEQKLKGMEDALSKKKQESSSESDPAKKEKLNKVITSISNNIEAAKQTIQDAKSKSNESEEHIFWAIDVMLLTIENQLLNFGNEDDYIYG